MSTSLSVTAFRPPDDKWKQMKAIYDLCIKANVHIPDEVEEFFNGEAPDPAGVEVELKEAIQEWSDKYRSGYQIDLSKLPSHIKYIRAYLS